MERRVLEQVPVITAGTLLGQVDDGVGGVVAVADAAVVVVVVG